MHIGSKDRRWEIVVNKDFMCHPMNNTGKRLTLDGASGKQYIFDLFSFDDFSELKDAFRASPAIYVFTRRVLLLIGSLTI